MATETHRAIALPARWRFWPEILLSVLTLTAFLGCLGSIEIWGKREQRAAVEAIDTVDHDHWLVAQIQGRPRLEKPPLPRWTIAALMIASGRRDEWVVRFPGALAGVITVAVIYLMGRSIAGRAMGLASAFVLCSLGFFVGEMRQASNDSLLALFTTLALYASFRRLRGEDGKDSILDPTVGGGPSPQESRGRKWCLLFYIALGLGFLTKGPVILVLVGMTVIPFLVFARRLRWGLGRLSDGAGIAAFLVLAASWPAAVLFFDPSALHVWALEMSEKTGLSRILEHRWHSPLVGQWPGMVLPWTLIAVVAVAAPLRLPLSRLWSTRTPGNSPGEVSDPAASDGVWFAWWWTVGNLAMFSTWAVAKPNYYTPCLPGMALLIGSTWLELTRAARREGSGASFARAILQLQWVLMYTAAILAPVAARGWISESLWPYSVLIALLICGSVILSVRIWRRGGDAEPLAPMVSACAFGLVIAYGIIAPSENTARSHRALAQDLSRLLPASVHSLNFFNEIDEGLWFYLRGHNLKPVPGTHPRYNTGFDLAQIFLTERQPQETLSSIEAKRRERDKQALFRWLNEAPTDSSFLLMRGSLYDRFGDELAPRLIPVYRETGVKRNDLILLQVTKSTPVNNARTPTAARSPVATSLR
jgi:4-amino-4-deoxy-L-arabinose transferase-like glycosyltransferase